MIRDSKSWKTSKSHYLFKSYDNFAEKSEFFLLDKLGKIVSGGFVINRTYPVKFLTVQYLMKKYKLSLLWMNSFALLRKLEKNKNTHFHTGFNLEKTRFRPKIFYGPPFLLVIIQLTRTKLVARTIKNI